MSTSRRASSSMSFNRRTSDTFRPRPFAVTLAGLATAELADQQRNLTFTDVQLMERGGDWAPSSDGAWTPYAVTTPRLAGGRVVE